MIFVAVKIGLVEYLWRSINNQTSDEFEFYKDFMELNTK